MATLKINNVEVDEKGQTSEAVRKASALVGVLQGAAVDILEKLYKAGLGNYTLIVEQQQSKFGDLYYEHVYGDQLNNRIQGREETIRNIHIVIGKLALRAFHDT
ncbi:hypothetical protein HHI36_001116 [Cryptolaemus montrouzieri]|uniref:Uncharacterized protein n=1 Tax=Cryptolaemus montrouzieri TaxID=559131 RepID=A0ABD2P7B0_9CUCU